ncbi:MATE family efflux transporter [Nitrincola nitratireducens]|uniref:MATE family efflux transporter n=1 Tax=Nitrincola nitratireducens TaxID=1229521 RepID=UPI001ED9B81D|nr:MATE family efflux transporter [Nitrincola nitratireducens]
MLAWAITTAIVISILVRRRQLKWRPLASIHAIFRHWGEVLSISIPAALSNITTPIANGVLTALVASHGAAAVAAFGVGNRLESLSLLVCLALSMTLPPLISQNYGAGQITRVKKAYSSVIRFALCWQLGLYLVFILIADPVSNWFTSDPDVAYWIKIWILIVPVGFGFQATTFLSASTFNALHQPLKALWISLIRLFLLYLLGVAWKLCRWVRGDVCCAGFGQCINGYAGLVLGEASFTEFNAARVDTPI